ncbi:MAG: 3-hydroxybutyryl-CoA dehydrogenase [Conexibacter sp.]|nr:3-hydroxybutyryl-CoA dehydrogenase [Conexibacter sp.]
MTLRDENDPIGMLGVVGAGFMGTGIAETAARAGVEVTVYEPEQAPLDRSRAQLSASTQTAVDRGKSSVADREALLERVRWTSDLDGLADAPLVIEAVVEDQDVKMDVFRRLDGVVRADALLASNTSSIPIAELASATTRPESVLGIHFFSPVPVMRLVEVVEALRTSASTMEAAHAFVERLGKRPIRTKDRAGFIVNMLLIPYLTAAVRMFEEGFASAEDIDAGMHLGCAHPMGPLQLCDFIGLDVMYAICRSLHDEFNRAEYAPPPLLKRMVASGMLGRKSGRGFYDYEEAA